MKTVAMPDERPLSRTAPATCAVRSTICPSPLVGITKSRWNIGSPGQVLDFMSLPPSGPDAGSE